MTNQPQKIVALVDGSTYSASVCDHAAWIASRTGAPVELIHVLGRREASDTHDHSGAIALGARTALMEQLAELDAQRAKLISHRGRAILDDAQALLEKAGVFAHFESPDENGERGMRLSFHLYNNTQDIDRFFSVFEAVRR